MPIPDGSVVAPEADPAEALQARETIRLAFVAAAAPAAAPARRPDPARGAALEGRRGGRIARHHRRASVNSALQRARASTSGWCTDRFEPLDEDQQALLARYVDAFERYDMSALTSLLHEDATQSMPPYEMWLAGRDEMLRWWFGPGLGLRSRQCPDRRERSPAFGQYGPARPAVGIPGRCRCSSSRGAGSSSSRPSSTPRRCFRSSGCRRGSGVAPRRAP